MKVLFRILYLIKKKLKRKYCIITYYLYLSLMNTWIGKNISKPVMYVGGLVNYFTLIKSKKTGTSRVIS